MKLNFYFFLILILPTALFGQDFQRLNIPVVQNGQVLQFPFAGGFNAPQTSSVDLNHDGKTDIFINDRIGGVPMAFIFDETVPGNYRYELGYVKYFPKTTNWALMLDFNKDNIPDLFTYSIAIGIDGITAYRGKWVNDTLHFTLVTSTGGPSNLILPFSQANGQKANLYVTTIDIPGFVDMDNDGDLDIVAFDSGGGFINYYKNYSKEKGFKSDSLIYSLDDQCWGKVFEGLSSSIALSPDPNKCSLGFLGGKITDRHVGSTSLALDLDGDGNKDMLIGDVSYPKITALYNTGNPSNAWVTHQDTAFPKYNIPVEFPDFVAAYVADIDNDSEQDLVFSPNSTGITEDRNVFQVYKPQTAGFSQMAKSGESFLTNQTIDLGSGSFPCFIDYDGDGDLDMIVGNFSFYTSIADRSPRLTYYTNIGSNSNPEFELTDSDFLGFSAFGATNWGLAPTVGDLDGDGDQDLLVGSEDGTIYYVQNTAGANSPVSFAPIVPNYKGLDAGQSSTPFIYDVDGDGLNDLIIGERNGNINFVPNIGTKGNPDFSANVDASPNINFFGKVDTREIGFGSGYSCPQILKIQGKLHLITGSLSGAIYFFDEIENNFSGKFNLINKYLGNTQEGERVRPVLVNLIPSDHYQVAIGNMRGGLGIFQTSLPNTSTSTTETKLFDVKIYPNPANNFIKISDNKSDYHITNIQIFDVLGRTCITKQIALNDQSLDIQQLSAGMYFVKIDGYDKTLTFVKMD